MAIFTYGLQQSLDGYVDHMRLGPPGPAVFRHFIDHLRNQAGCLYGRRTYEIMRYWDDDQPDWDTEEHDFAAVWRSRPKWVVSRTLSSTGPNATLIQNGIETALRDLKARHTGEIGVAGPDLARRLADLGLIDQYHLYLRPVILGHGTPFFAAPRPPLRLTATQNLGEDMVQLTYVPA